VQIVANRLQFRYAKFLIKMLQQIRVRIAGICITADFEIIPGQRPQSQGGTMRARCSYPWKNLFQQRNGSRNLIGSVRENALEVCLFISA